MDNEMLVEIKLLLVEIKLLNERLRYISAELGKQTNILGDIRTLLRLMHYGPSNALAQEVE